MKQLLRGNERHRNIVLLIVVLMVILVARLFVLTMVQHDTWEQQASEQNTKTIYTSAPRGNIYDRNGVLLAGSRQIFTAVFNASALDTEEINSSSLALINKLIENGDDYQDDFPIQIDGNGNFYYTYTQEQQDWLAKHGFSAGTSASQVVDSLRQTYSIDPALDRYEAVEALSRYNISLPVYAKTMKFTYQNDLENFWAKFGFTEDEIKEGIPADVCFQKLRENFLIDESLSDAEARKIFIVRNEIASNNAMRYLPITVATDISDETVVFLSEEGLPGVSVSSASERYYPYGSSACHVLGYMGAISESEQEVYSAENGYLTTDLVGKDGLEAAMESKLHGTPGIKRVRVNSYGEYVSTISETEAQKGADVYTTLDINLQKDAEASLAKYIAKNETSESGAVVAVDTKTGEVLALVSYPAFDLNLFADGISTAEWASVQPTNPRDNLSPAPLYNNATMTSVAPGSTFKPITSLAALGCGLDPNLQIYDAGHVSLGDREFGCDLWNNGGGSHGSENLEWGIGNSCNYYFYCIATNKDWGSGASLGYTKDISVDTIMETASSFGLGHPTGLEISEIITPLTSKETKLAAFRASCWYAIYENSHTYFSAEVYDDQDLLYENIDTIVDWMEENPDYDVIVDRLLSDTDVREDQVDNLATMIKFDYFNLSGWTTGDAFNMSIGQGYNAYTPAQMARYVAGIANHGQLNELTLVYGVEGEGLNNLRTATDTGVTDENWNAVKAGMRRVVTSGTLSWVFGGFGVDVCGKTGTAENQGVKQPADELAYIQEYLGTFNSNYGLSITWEQIEAKMEELMKKDPEEYSTKQDTVDQALIELSDFKITSSRINAFKGSYEPFAWTVTFAPADDPQIAVVVMLIDGGYSENAAPIAREVLASYFGLDGYQKTVTYDKSAGMGTNIVN